jgi:hypothetical protein
MKNLVALVFVVVLSSPAFAWNEKGHLVTARLAWRQLTEEQRGKILALLKKHPHYEGFLIANKPEGFSEDQYDHPTWHYINYPIVPAGSAVDPAQHEPPAKQENVVNQLAACLEKINGGSDEDKAVYLTWLFHLVGDVHQPLHCTAVFSEHFPDGDRGGNLALLRIRSGPTNLHSYWDGLLGTGTTAGTIGKDVEEIEKVLLDKAGDIGKELEKDQTFESWAREGLVLSKGVVYLNGELKVAVGSSRRGGRDDDVPEAPAEYAASCGRVARVQVGKAGLRLAEQLKKLLP